MMRVSSLWKELCAWLAVLLEKRLLQLEKCELVKSTVFLLHFGFRSWRIFCEPVLLSWFLPSRFWRLNHFWFGQPHSFWVRSFVALMQVQIPNFVHMAEEHEGIWFVTRFFVCGLVPQVVFASERRRNAIASPLFGNSMSNLVVQFVFTKHFGVRGVF